MDSWKRVVYLQGNTIDMELDNHSLERYSRQLLLKGFGVAGQKRLHHARVLVVGLGGLGCPVVQTLAGAGVGHLGLVDGDKVSRSNLHRQLIYKESDIGQLKVNVAKQFIQAINTTVQVTCFPEFLNSDNAKEIAQDFDILVDCSDNFPCRYLVNDLGVILNKPVVFGAVHAFEGQVAVFNVAQGSGWSPNYRDLYPTPPAPDTVHNCAETGVLGVLPSIVGNMQALETIKWICGLGDLLLGKLWMFDGLSNKATIIKYTAQVNRDTIQALVDYEQFCGISSTAGNDLEVSPLTLKEWLASEEVYLLDIRTAGERAITDIGGTWVDPQYLDTFLSNLPAGRKVVLYCRSGRRSLNLAEKYQTNQNIQLFSLKGGLLGYRDYFALDIPQY